MSEKIDLEKLREVIEQHFAPDAQPLSLGDTVVNPSPDELRHQVSAVETELRAAHEELKARFEKLLAFFPNLNHL